MTASKLKVLYAAANAADARSLIERLEKHGGGRFEIESVLDLAVALQRSEPDQFDLLLLDA